MSIERMNKSVLLPYLIESRQYWKEKNAARFLAQRAAGKTYYRVDGDLYFWWSPDELEDQKPNFKEVAVAMIRFDVNPVDVIDYCTPWSIASQKAVERILRKKDHDITIHSV